MLSAVPLPVEYNVLQREEMTDEAGSVPAATGTENRAHVAPAPEHSSSLLIRLLKTIKQSTNPQHATGVERLRRAGLSRVST